MCSYSILKYNDKASKENSVFRYKCIDLLLRFC